MRLSLRDSNSLLSTLLLGKCVNDMEKVKDLERLESSKIQFQKDLEKVKKREQDRIKSMEDEITGMDDINGILEENKEKVDGVFEVLRGLKGTKEDWRNLDKFLEDRKEGDGEIIEKVNWVTSHVSVNLKIWGGGCTELDFSISCGKNLEKMWKIRNSRDDKLEKTRRSGGKAVEASERRGGERLKVYEKKVSCGI